MLDINSFQLILDNLPVGLLYLKLEDEKRLKFKILYTNNTLCKLTNYNIKEFINLSLREAFPPLYIDNAKSPKNYLKALKTQKTIDVGEFEYEDKNLQLKTYMVTAIPYSDVHVLLWVSDTEDLKHLQLKFDFSKLKLKQTEEKNILLKEIHHRVKNNLQLIMSLVRMQSRFSESIYVREYSKETLYRVKAIAIIEELLYKSKNLKKIKFKKFIQELSKSLVTTIKGDTNEVTIKIDVQKQKLNIDTFIPLGLLINEILSNALKHGIPEKKGIIFIKLEEIKESNFRLIIGDNGKGLKKDINLINPTSLGLSIVNKFTKQLRGKITRDNSIKGTHFIIDFEEI